MDYFTIETKARRDFETSLIRKGDQDPMSPQILAWLSHDLLKRDLRLVKRIHVTLTIQSECFISTQRSYSMVKLIDDIDYTQQPCYKSNLTNMVEYTQLYSLLFKQITKVIIHALHYSTMLRIKKYYLRNKFAATYLRLFNTINKCLNYIFPIT